METKSSLTNYNFVNFNFSNRNDNNGMDKEIEKRNVTVQSCCYNFVPLPNEFEDVGTILDRTSVYENKPTTLSRTTQTPSTSLLNNFTKPKRLKLDPIMEIKPQKPSKIYNIPQKSFDKFNKLLTCYSDHYLLTKELHELVVSSNVDDTITNFNIPSGVKKVLDLNLLPTIVTILKRSYFEIIYYKTDVKIAKLQTFKLSKEILETIKMNLYDSKIPYYKILYRIIESILCLVNLKAHNNKRSKCNDAVVNNKSLKFKNEKIASKTRQLCF